MVKVKSTNSAGETIEFYQDGKLYNSLTKFVIPSLQLKDDDIVFVIDGPERCQPEGSKVLMADGEWKNIEDIKEGDEIISPQEDGSNIFSKITKTYQWYSRENYNVTELNHKKKILYKCSSNHLIPINLKVKPRINRQRLAEDNYWKIRNITAQTFNNYKNHTKNNTTTLSCFAIEKFQDKKNCMIEPYTLGVLIGDGCLRKVISITNSKLEVLEEIKKWYPIMRITKRWNKGMTYTYFISRKDKLRFELERTGLYNKDSGTKFIPKEALYSDADYRKRLLAGLIDTDGYLSKSGGYSITTKSKQLAEDILWLVYSLGGRGNIKKVIKGIRIRQFLGEYYNVSFYIGNLKLPLKIKYKIKISKTWYLSPNRISINVLPARNEECMVYGFTIDSPSQLYITDNWMITHNSGKCCSEDTLIRTNRASLGGKYTIKWMYNQFHGNPDKMPTFKQWNLKIPTYVRSYNGHSIQLHKINDVVYSGRQKIWRLELEDGKFIKCTANHKIMTNNGFVELQNLNKERDLVMCDTPNSKVPAFVKIKSIIEVGLEDTYDIVCDEPNHNFSANDIIIHNSVFAMQLARTIDKDFNLSKICFTPDEFRAAIEKANKRDCIIFDEAYTGLSSKRALSEVNHLLISLMMQCQPANSKVLMANGEWKNIEDVQIGDEVISPQEDGLIKFTKVIKTYKWYSEENYDVYLRRKEPIKLYSCSWNHKIPILYHRNKLINYTAQEYSKLSRLTKNNYVALKSFPIPYFKDRQNCEIEPYTLGVWLGDGSFTTHCRIAIGTKDEIIGQEIKKYYNIQSIEELNPPTRKNYCFSLKDKLAKQLERYGLRNHRAGTKFIPKEALLSDIEYRKRLLAGLIDSDGYLYNNSCYRITLKSERLVYDIADLVQSLGGKVRIYKEKYSILKSGIKARYYSVFIYIKEDLKIPFMLARRRKTKQKSRICNNHEIIDVKLSEKQDYVYGFTLDSSSGWYITDNWMITHNCGQKNLVILIVMPTFFMLEKYVALFRARGLFHIYRKGVKKGYFLYFNAEKKKILFLAGQKMMSYKGCRANFRGRFLNKYVIDEAKYRKLKEKALTSSSLDKKENKLQDQRDRFIYMVWREWMKSRRNIERLCYIYGIDIKARQISTIIEGLYLDLEPESVARKRNLILELRRRQKIKENINKSMIDMKNKMEKDIKVQIDELNDMEDENLDEIGLEQEFLGGTGAVLPGLGDTSNVIQDTYKRSKNKLSDTPNNSNKGDVKDA